MRKVFRSPVGILLPCIVFFKSSGDSKQIKGARFDSSETGVFVPLMFLIVPLDDDFVLSSRIWFFVSESVGYCLKEKNKILCSLMFSSSWEFLVL